MVVAMMLPSREWSGFPDCGDLTTLYHCPVGRASSRDGSGGSVSSVPSWSRGWGGSFLVSRKELEVLFCLLFPPPFDSLGVHPSVRSLSIKLVWRVVSAHLNLPPRVRPCFGFYARSW